MTLVPRPSTDDAAPPARRLVIKFGGTSLASPSRIRLAARRVEALHRAGWGPVVVVSAGGQLTDRLLSRIAAVSAPASLSPTREHDRVLATGEDLSAALFALALTSRGVPSRSLRGGEAGVGAAGTFGAGVPDIVIDAPLRALVDEGIVPVVAGFQGARSDGETLTLGRGGSDLSAVVLAVALDATCCHIVTDVDGVYDVDPRVIPTARRFVRLGWRHLTALTDQGAQVVHPLAARRAEHGRVPLRVYHFRARSLLAAGTEVGLVGAPVLAVHEPCTSVREVA